MGCDFVKECPRPLVAVAAVLRGNQVALATCMGTRRIRSKLKITSDQRMPSIDVISLRSHLIFLRFCPEYYPRRGTLDRIYPTLCHRARPIPRPKVLILYRNFKSQS